MSMADQVAENVDYFAKRVSFCIKQVRQAKTKKRRKEWITILGNRSEDLAYWATYLKTFAPDLTERGVDFRGKPKAASVKRGR